MGETVFPRVSVTHPFDPRLSEVEDMTTVYLEESPSGVSESVYGHGDGP